MNQISNGDELLAAILEYCEAQWKNTKKLYIIIVIVIYVIFMLLLLFNRINNNNTSLLQILLAPPIISILGTLFVWSLFNFTSLKDSINNKKLIFILNDAKCYVYEDDEVCIFSFYISSKNKIYENKETKNSILKIIKHLLPNYAMIENEDDIIVEIYAMPSKIKNSTTVKNTLMIDLETIINDKVYKANNLLPEDIKNKGLEMSEAYIYLYCIENSLRLFIENFYTQKYGVNYENSIGISSSIQQTISNRKKQEQNNKWVSVRGNSFLFYLDFKELADIIVNNKDILQKFPNEHWLKVKINELGTIRNLIAHNSYLSQNEKDAIRINYHHLLMQMK